MARIARKSFETSFFHIITQGINREFIYKKAEYIEEYIRLIKKYKDEYGISVLAFCIMSNHAHMLLYVKTTEEMAKFMHKVNGIYAQYYNRNENRVGIVFRNRYVSEAIYNEDYLIKCIKYIHMNPVKAGIVKRCDEYIYSSYQDFVNNSGVARSPILTEMFGNNFTDIFNDVNQEMIFNDIDINEEDRIDGAIREYLDRDNKSLEDVLKDRESKKKFIKYLKNNQKITYVAIMKRLNITAGEMNSLKKDNF